MKNWLLILMLTLSLPIVASSESPTPVSAAAQGVLPELTPRSQAIVDELDAMGPEGQKGDMKDDQEDVDEAQSFADVSGSSSPGNSSDNSSDLSASTNTPALTEAEYLAGVKELAIEQRALNGAKSIKSKDKEKKEDKDKQVAQEKDGDTGDGEAGEEEQNNSGQRGALAEFAQHLDRSEKKLDEVVEGLVQLKYGINQLESKLKSKFDDNDDENSNMRDQPFANEEDNSSNQSSGAPLNANQTPMSSDSASQQATVCSAPTEANAVPVPVISSAPAVETASPPAPAVTVAPLEQPRREEPPADEEDDKDKEEISDDGDENKGNANNGGNNAGNQFKASSDDAQAWGKVTEILNLLAKNNPKLKELNEQDFKKLAATFIMKPPAAVLVQEAIVLDPELKLEDGNRLLNLLFYAVDADSGTNPPANNNNPPVQGPGWKKQNIIIGLGIAVAATAGAVYWKIPAKVRRLLFPNDKEHADEELKENEELYEQVLKSLSVEDKDRRP